MHQSDRELANILGDALLPWTAENKLLGPLREALGAGYSEHSVNLRNNAS
jgi:hypothetical protein